MAAPSKKNNPPAQPAKLAGGKRAEDILLCRVYSPRRLNGHAGVVPLLTNKFFIEILANHHLPIKLH